MSAAYKTCGCGRSYQTKADWKKLEYAGFQITDDETGWYKLEMRHCACNSTLGMEHRMGWFWSAWYRAMRVFQAFKFVA